MKNIIAFVLDMARLHFDKLLLLVVFHILVGIAYVSPLETTKTWAMGQGNTVIGAIIAIVMKESGLLSKKEPEKDIDHHAV